MVKFSDSHHRPDMFAVDGLRFQDSFYLRIVPFQGLIMVLLTRGHLPVAHGHLLQDALYAVKPLTAAIRHVKSLPPQRSIELPL